MNVTQTKWYGISIVKENQTYYLIDDNGNENAFDHEPTPQEIDAFKDAVVKY